MQIIAMLLTLVVTDITRALHAAIYEFESMQEDNEYDKIIVLITDEGGNPCGTPYQNDIENKLFETKFLLSVFVVEVGHLQQILIV